MAEQVHRCKMLESMDVHIAKNSVITLINQQLTNQLLIQLDERNQAFKQELRAKHKSLTNYDLNLCLYLKSGLSTKQIAQILSITPDSVKKAKHRLRKKMNIKPHKRWDDVFDT